MASTKIVSAQHLVGRLEDELERPPRGLDAQQRRAEVGDDLARDLAEREALHELRGLRVGSGPIVVSEIEAPSILANLV